MSNLDLASRGCLTRKEVAYFLQCSVATVDRGIRDKTYPYNTAFKVGRRAVRFPAEVILGLSQCAEKDASK